MQHIHGSRNFTAGGNISVSHPKAPPLSDQVSTKDIIRLQAVQITLLGILTLLTAVQYVQNKHLKSEIDEMRHLSYRTEAMLREDGQ
ncbi:hypothetical protein [Desulfosediminicola sp.]|uniref:hypothetical protein n=1 Tax=Desulfosediminicola sp. TaxID=2886825 RepID=UPI003AF2E5A5